MTNSFSIPKIDSVWSVTIARGVDYVTAVKLFRRSGRRTAADDRPEHVKRCFHRDVVGGSRVLAGACEIIRPRVNNGRRRRAVQRVY